LCILCSEFGYYDCVILSMSIRRREREPLWDSVGSAHGLTG
jgi:hypothetical protein